MYVLQFNYHTSFLYLSPLGIRQKVHLWTPLFITSEYRSIPQTRDFKAISDCQQRPLEECLRQRVVCLIRQLLYPVIGTSPNGIGLHSNCRIGISLFDIPYSYIYAGSDPSANHAIPSHISLGLRLCATIPKESILTVVPPLFQHMDDCQHLLVMDFIVPLDRTEAFGEEGNWMLFSAIL